MFKLKTALVADSSAITNMAIQYTLNSYGLIKIETVNDFFDLRKKLVNELDILIIDANLEGKYTGIQFVREIYEEHKIAVIFLTTSMNEEIVEISKKLNVIGFLKKPFDESDLLEILDAYERGEEIDKFQRNISVFELN